jgi:hypothetical protein
MQSVLCCDSKSIVVNFRRRLCSLVVSLSVYADGCFAAGEGPRPELLTKPSTSCANSSCYSGSAIGVGRTKELLVAPKENHSSRALTVHSNCETALVFGLMWIHET